MSPSGRLGTLPEGDRGGYEAARALARLLRAASEESVRRALAACLAEGGRFDELAFRRSRGAV